MKPRGPFETGTMLALGFGAMGCGTAGFLAALLPLSFFFTPTDGGENLGGALLFLFVFGAIGITGWYSGIQLIFAAGRSPGDSKRQEDHHGF